MIDTAEWEDLLDILSGFSAEEDPKYEEAEQNYYKAFGHIPPTAMIPDGFDKERIIQAMNECVAQNDDDIIKILGIVIEDRFIY